MYYGQYCQREKDRKGRTGYTGVREGIDFDGQRRRPCVPLRDYARTGDSNGTVAIYNEEYDITLLYLHCEKIQVHRGEVLEAGDKIAVEGKELRRLVYPC